MVDCNRSRYPTLRDESVLITGGAGFIGSHLADRLVDTCDVTVLDNLSGGKREHVPDDVEFIQGDIRDKATVKRAVAGVDVIFHEAALVSVTESVERPVKSHEINFDATLALLECARIENSRVVIASSTAIYGEPTTIPVSESDLKTPSSPYGLDKLTADQYARLYHERYDLETVSLRYFNVYGPRQQGGAYGGVISIFVDQAVAGDPITIHGDGTQTRDFVHVRDVVDANVLAAQTGTVGESFNIGTENETAIIELAEYVRDAVDKSVETIHEPGRPSDISRSRSDISKARRELNFEPQVGLESGIHKLVERRL